jgi:hypothetical protein
MNTNLDTALAYIWHSCQSEANANRNPPEYWFSFSRRYREPLDGIMSKDMVQSYVTAPERSPTSHPCAYGFNSVDRGIPAQEDIQSVTGEEKVYEAVDDRDGEDNTRDHRHPDPTYHGANETVPTIRPNLKRITTNGE